MALVDIRMPDLDGYGVAQAIRKLDFGAEILLIALTAYAADDAVAAAKGAGFDLHLSKTVRPDEILRAIVSGGI